MVYLCFICVSSAAPAWAQHEHHDAEAPTSGWGWSADASVFLTANFQVRAFTDFYQVESQNWFMGAGTRRVGVGTVSLEGMLSLEPFTLRDLGSSQVFQTGETYGGVPLIDYQHPHDLLMKAAASYTRLVGGAQVTLTGALVGDPALGPTPFMHRAAAAPNPTVPLAHHMTDSTHITPGVITAGVLKRGLGLEASVFNGREPDENRLDLDLDPLDSWSTRGSWSATSAAGARIHAQASGARVHEPSPIEPGNQTRLTASLEYSAAMVTTPLALTLAWGQNHNTFGTENGWLAEAALGVSTRGTVYARGEIVDKHILHAGGEHPPGFYEPDILSTVGSLTLGYTHRVATGGWGVVSLGGDATGFHTPDNLFESYGHPFSGHLYVHWAPR